MGTNTLLFIPGAGDMHAPDGSGGLARYLRTELENDWSVVAPEMPAADDPSYGPWRDRVERELAATAGAAVLVGHSLGGSVLLKYLAEGSNRTPIHGLFLVAVPDWGPDGWAYEDFAVPEDVASRLPTPYVFLYQSRGDPVVPFAHLRRYEQRIPSATSRALAGKDHSFVNGLPELVADIRRLDRERSGR